MENVGFWVAVVLALAVVAHKLTTRNDPAPPVPDGPVAPMTFWRTVLAVIVGMTLFSIAVSILYFITH
jgi:hypothetical protein